MITQSSAAANDFAANGWTTGIKVILFIRSQHTAESGTRAIEPAVFRGTEIHVGILYSALRTPKHSRFELAELVEGAKTNRLQCDT
jgi:hypothetical protein